MSPEQRSRQRFYARMVLLRAGRDLYLLSYMGLAGIFGYLDRHQFRRRLP